MTTREMGAFDPSPFYPSFIGFDSLFDNLGNALRYTEEGSFPAHNIYRETVDDETHYVLEIALPGIPKASVHASFDGGILTVWNDEPGKAADGRTYTYRGIPAGTFKMVKSVDASLEYVSGKWDEGVLRFVFREKKPETPEVKELTIE